MHRANREAESLLNHSLRFVGLPACLWMQSVQNDIGWGSPGNPQQVAHGGQCLKVENLRSDRN
jgi:hypothetical protein